MDFVVAGCDFAIEASVAEFGEDVGDVGALFDAELDDVVAAQDWPDGAGAIEVITDVPRGFRFRGEGIGEKRGLGNRREKLGEFTRTKIIIESWRESSHYRHGANGFGLFTGEREATDEVRNVGLTGVGGQQRPGERGRC